MTDSSTQATGDTASPLLTIDSPLHVVSISPETSPYLSGLPEAAPDGGLHDQRRAVAAGLGAQEFAGGPLRPNARALSLFAESAVDQLLNAEISASLDAGKLRSGDGLFVLAMGKLGGRELNASSDIDLIAFFDPDRFTATEYGEEQRLATGIIRRLTARLQDATDKGFLFRTDWRLRPDPSATPLAVSVSAAHRYYQARGRTWERSAFIKARVIAGDRQAGAQFLADLSPFIWRQRLDLAAMESLWDMRNAIRASHPTAKEELNAVGPDQVRGLNLKLGSGGIREIEFCASALQLVWGGRHPYLRTHGTLNAFARLTDGGFMEPEVAADLIAAYTALRHCEDRLQYRENRQTHSIPADDKALEQALRTLGFDSERALIRFLEPHRTRALKHFNALFTSIPLAAMHQSWPVSWSTSENAEIAENWRQSLRAVRTPQGQTALTGLVETLNTAETNFDAFDQLLSRTQLTTTQLTALASSAPARELTAHCLTAGPVLARALTDQPALIEAFAAPGFREPLPLAGALTRQLREQLSDTADTEELIRRCAQFVQEQRLKLAVQISEGRGTAADWQRGFSDLADVALTELATIVLKPFADLHGWLPGMKGRPFGGLAIIAMGKAGARQMTYSSDLDLVFVHPDMDVSTESDGPKPLTMPVWYARLAQRLIAALTARTRSGRLYDIDTRLRPHGSKGVLAINLKGYARYLEQTAWTWELMALGKARIILGDPAFSEKITNLFARVLARPLPDRLVRNDAARMLARLPEITPDAPDVKAAGLMRAEFLMRFSELLGEASPLEPLVAQAQAIQQRQRITGAAALSVDDRDALTRLQQMIEAETDRLACRTIDEGLQEGPVWMRDETAS